MRELATRKVVRRELGPSRVRLDGPRNIAVAPQEPRGAVQDEAYPVPPDIPAVPAVRSGLVVRCALFGRLAGAERVVQMSAPAGSGKTVLMRSWIAEAGLARHIGWVSVDREVRHPRRFWIAVADALRGTAARSALVRALTPAPGLEGWGGVGAADPGAGSRRLGGGGAAAQGPCPAARPAVAADRRRAFAGPR